MAVYPSVGQQNWAPVLQAYIDAKAIAGNAKDFGATGNNSTDDTAAITAALAAGNTFLPAGTYKISASIPVPANTSLTLTAGATIRQTASLTPALTVSTAGVRITGGTLQGLTSDYLDDVSVYGAAAIEVKAAASDLVVQNVAMLGWAGAGVNIEPGAGSAVVDSCTITGPGSAYILNPTFSRGVGVRTQSTNRLRVSCCDISAFAQGIITVTGTTDLTVVDNLIHDIPGQHGSYIQSVGRLVYTGNTIRNCGSTGMKIQLGSLADPDAFDCVVSDNVISNVTAQGILLTNTAGSGGAVLRRVQVRDNVVDTAQSGVEANNVDGASISGNIIYNSSSEGVQLESLNNVSLTNNIISNSAAQGILLDTVTDVRVTGNRIINPGGSASTSVIFGIQMVNSHTDVVISDNNITDTAAKMRYGIYINTSTNEATFTVSRNYVAGATDYGIRFLAAAAIREFDGNNVTGGLGTVLNAPTGGRGRTASDYFGAAAPTTGAWQRGDRMWNTAPAASGTIGWVCVTAGTPGTWKTYGAISA